MTIHRHHHNHDNHHQRFNVVRVRQTFINTILLPSTTARPKKIFNLFICNKNVFIRFGGCRKRKKTEKQDRSKINHAL